MCKNGLITIKDWSSLLILKPKPLAYYSNEANKINHLFISLKNSTIQSYW